MTGNLRDRLKRIQNLKKTETAVDILAAALKTRTPENSSFADLTSLTEKGWIPCGFQVLKREVLIDFPTKNFKKMPAALPIIIPDLAKKASCCINDFIFFDLETTGLSGGAGTVAFLAAFGQFSPDGKLRVTQYLLLDYPGENDFLEAVLVNFKIERSVIVSYNGKSFDSNILKTRCLMNGIKPPEYTHADLLHPARRLWKNIITDCSQSSIETQILGLDRKGDMPGSLAPDIWFEFLKTGGTDWLMGICDHNIRDITGLASILCAMFSIAEDPFKAEKYNINFERLALRWRDIIRKSDRYLQLTNEGDGYEQYEELQLTGNNLLKYAADKGYKRAVYVYSFDQMRKGNYHEALDFARRGLKLFGEDTIWHEKLLRRIERLEKKI
ncbi:MAG: ribonuclease H-like domain-containing protein [Treponema sp.]|nr:ribonuclease H-like domain-containing protein [Treponema sp.]